jgi:hypothetical protein
LQFNLNDWEQSIRLDVLSRDRRKENPPVQISRRGKLKLRTFDGERVKGELTTDHHLSEDGVPVLVVGGEAYLPDEADFFIELATDEQLEALDDAGYDLPLWEDREIDESEEEEVIEETDEV